MCILTCCHQWNWARPFCVAGAVFFDVAQSVRCIFVGTRAEFCVFFDVSDPSFFVFCRRGCLVSIVICPFQNLLLMQAKRIFVFPIFKSENVHFAATNEFEHVHVAWQAQCFLTLHNLFVAFSLAHPRNLAFLDGPSFSLLVSVGGGSGGGVGGGGIITFLPCRPMMLRSWLSSLDVNTSMMLRSWLFFLWFYKRLLNRNSQMIPERRLPGSEATLAVVNRRKISVLVFQVMVFLLVFCIGKIRKSIKTHSCLPFQPTARQTVCA